MNIKDSAKTIVCYGDSNTWGRIPKGERYPRSIRWPGVLQNLLGNDYEVLSEGLNGRTFVAEDPEAPQKTGITHLRSILKTNLPIDLVIVMLGTNDVKNIYNLKAEDIAKHLEQTINIIQLEATKNILVVCPPDIVIPEDGNIDPRYINSSETMKKLPELFKKMTEKYKCNFINAGDHISSSKIDGFHLDPEMHKKLAEILSKKIVKII